MACANISGITYDICANSIGGVKRIWLADYKDGCAIVDSGTSGTSMISGFTSAVTIATDFKLFPIRKNTASFTSTVNINDEGGNYISTELVMSFSRMETGKRLAMNALVLADAMAVVEDANGKYWFLGFDNPLGCTAGEGATGTAKSDGNRYSITLTDDSVEFPYEVDPALAASLPQTTA